MCIRPKPHTKSLYLSSLIFVFSFTCVFWGSCTTTTFFWKCWSITNRYLFSQLQLIHYSLHWSGYRTNVQKYMCNLYEFCEENEGYLKQSLGNRQLVGKVEDFAMEWGRTEDYCWGKMGWSWKSTTRTPRSCRTAPEPSSRTSKHGRSEGRSWLNWWIKMNESIVKIFLVKPKNLNQH